MKKGKSILKQLDEILELVEVPEYRTGLLAKHEDLLRIYHEEIDFFLKEKYFGAFKKSDDYKFFRLQSNAPKSEKNSVLWDITIDDCDNPEEIITPELINYILSHEVNPHHNVEDKKFYNKKYEIFFSFVRYTEFKIIGQVYWKPLNLGENNFIQVVPNFQWKNLSEGAQAQIFLEQFNLNKDVRNAILLYFANYVYPYTTAIAI